MAAVFCACCAVSLSCQWRPVPTDAVLVARVQELERTVQSLQRAVAEAKQPDSVSGSFVAPGGAGSLEWVPIVFRDSENGRDGSHSVEIVAERTEAHQRSLLMTMQWLCPNRGNQPGFVQVRTTGRCAECWPDTRFAAAVDMRSAQSCVTVVWLQAGHTYRYHLARQSVDVLLPDAERHEAVVPSFHADGRGLTLKPRTQVSPAMVNAYESGQPTDLLHWWGEAAVAEQ